LAGEDLDLAAAVRGGGDDLVEIRARHAAGARAGGEPPAFVPDEFEAYLRCGIPIHGFRVHAARILPELSRWTL
jgi:hypothetical protein